MPLFLFLCFFAAATLASSLVKRTPPSPAFHRRQANPPPGALVDFQVYEPVLTPSGSSDQYGCVYTKVLMEYDFANSYGAPFVGTRGSS